MQNIYPFEQIIAQSYVSLRGIFFLSPFFTKFSQKKSQKRAVVTRSPPQPLKIFTYLRPPRNFFCLKQLKKQQIYVTIILYVKIFYDKTAVCRFAEVTNVTKGARDDNAPRQYD